MAKALKPLTDTRLRKRLKKVTAPQTGWLDVFPAIMGTANGIVLTGINGVVWVRNILNGQLLAVYNSAVPNIPLLQVEVGRRVDQPGLWQVKGTLESYNVPASSSSSSAVDNHHEQHEFLQTDTVWVDPKQIMQLTVLVADADDFLVRVIGSVIHTSDGVAQISTQTVDLSSYVPTEGALFVIIQADNDGLLSVVDGTPFASPLAGTFADVPAPDADHHMIAFVLLHESMTELSNDDIRLPRLFGGGGAGGSFDGNVTEQFQFTGIINETLSADTHDWNPTGLATATIIRVDTEDLVTLSGIEAGAGGKVLVIINIGDQDLWLSNSDENSTEENRFLLEENLKISPNSAAMIWYDADTERWRQMDVQLSVTELQAIINATIIPVPYAIGGRLTLVTGVPVMTTTQAAKTTIYWTPYHGQIIPIYDGNNMVPTDVGGELSQATTDNTKSPAAVANNSNYDLFVWNDGGTYRCTRGPAWSSDTARGTGAGTTELEVVKGIVVNKIAITNGPAAQRGTYVGTVRSNGSAQIDYTFAGAANGGTAGIIGVWNMYNRVDVEMSVHDTTASWTFSSATAGPLNPGGTGSGLNNRISYVIGLAEDSMDLRMYCRGRTAAVNGAHHFHGIGVDSTTVISALGTVLTLSATAIEGNAPCFLAVNGQLGFHYAQMLQDGDGTNTSSMFGGGNQNGLIVKGRF